MQKFIKQQKDISMSTVKKEIEVSKEFGELGELIQDLIINGYRASKKDKVGASAIIAAMLPTFVQKIGPALEGIELVDDEAKENPFAFSQVGINIANAIYKEIQAQKKNEE